MWPYLRTLAQHLASFVAVERRRKAKKSGQAYNPVSLSAWELACNASDADPCNSIFKKGEFVHDFAVEPQGETGPFLRHSDADESIDHFTPVIELDFLAAIACESRELFSI